MAEVTLTSSSGTTRVFKEQEVSNLKSMGKADYVKADVSNGTYIFYSNEGFNRNGSGDHAILKPGPITPISHVNGSYYCLPDNNEGVILFAHPNFGGNHEWYKEHCADLTKDFPPGQAGGVSAAIVLSKNQDFALWTEKNYKGEKKELHPGPIEQYQDLSGIIGDRVQSLNKV